LIEFRVLGGIELRGHDGSALEALIAQPKRLALLAYLCIAAPVAAPHGYHRRDRLITLFWPHADSRHARGSLRKAIHALRHAAGANLLVTRGMEEIGINSSVIRSDVMELRRALVEHQWERALDLYRGELLDALFVPRAPEYERWLDRQREELRAGVAGAALHLAEQHLHHGAFGPAAENARHSLGLEPCEPALRLLMLARSGMGDRVGALRAYYAFARYSADEYGIEPSSETRSLLERISGEHVLHHETPAVDVEGRTGDEARAFRREKQKQFSHLHRFS